MEEKCFVMESLIMDPAFVNLFAIPDGLNFTPVYGNVLSSASRYLAVLLERTISGGASETTLQLLETMSSVVMIVDTITSISWNVLCYELYELPPSHLIAADWSSDCTSLAVVSRSSLHVLRKVHGCAVSEIVRHSLFFIPSCVTWDPLSGGWLVGGSAGLVLYHCSTNAIWRSESLLRGRHVTHVTHASASQLLVGLMDGRVCVLHRAPTVSLVPLESVCGERVASLSYSAARQCMAVASSSGQVRVATVSAAPRYVGTLQEESDALDGTRPFVPALFTEAGNLLFGDVTANPPCSLLLVADLSSRDSKVACVRQENAPIRGVALRYYQLSTLAEMFDLRPSFSGGSVWLCTQAKCIVSIPQPLTSSIPLCERVSLDFASNIPLLVVDGNRTPVPFLPRSLLQRYCILGRTKWKSTPRVTIPFSISESHFLTFAEHNLWILNRNTLTWQTVIDPTSVIVDIMQLSVFDKHTGILIALRRPDSHVALQLLNIEESGVVRRGTSITTAFCEHRLCLLSEKNSSKTFRLLVEKSSEEFSLLIGALLGDTPEKLVLQLAQEQSLVLAAAKAICTA